MNKTERSKLGPHLIARRNTEPYQLLPSADAEEMTVGLAAAVRDINQLKEECLQRLFEEIGETAPGPQRRELVGFRRDLCKQKVNRAAVDTATWCRTRVQLTAWADQQKALNTRLEQTHAAFLDHERSVLRRWAADPSMQKALAGVNRGLVTAARHYAGHDLDRRASKSEAALLSHYSRTTTRVSPFGLLTAVDVQLFDAENADAISKIATMVSPSLLAYRRLFRKIAEHGPMRDTVLWSIAPGLYVDAERFTFRRSNWVDEDSRARVDAPQEEVISIPRSATWDALLTELRPLTGEPLHTRQIDAVLQHALPLSSPAEAFELLAKAGILRPVQHIPEQTSDFLDRWTAWLDRHRDHLPDHAHAAHLGMVETVTEFAEMDATERVEALTGLEALWATALDVKAEASRIANLVYEDASYGTATVPEAARVTSWVDSVTALLPFLLRLDEQATIAVAIEEAFLTEFGQDGVCTDLRRFADTVGTRLAQFFGSESSVADSTRQEALKAQRREAEALVERWTDSSLDELEVTDMLEHLEPALERTSSLNSLAVFGHANAEEFVLNHVYGGAGRFASRFLSEHRPEVRDALAGYLSRLHEGSRVVQMRPTLGFNANLSPLLADVELEVDGETITGSRVRVDDLTLSYDGTRLRLYDSAAEREVRCAYLGFLIPSTLPPVQMLLAAIYATPQVSLAHFDVALHRKLIAALTPVARAPRIRAGSVVVRRQRFAMAKEELLTHVAGQHVVLASLWREQYEIPRLVYITELRPKALTPRERIQRPKPIFVDFGSQLHLQHLAKRLARIDENIIVEEFLPVPTTPYAEELIFEVNPNMEGARS